MPGTKAKITVGKKLRDVAGRTTDPRIPWYAASDPQNKPRGWPTKQQVTCPNITAQPQVTVAKVNSRTAKKERANLARLLPNLRKGKSYKKLA